MNNERISRKINKLIDEVSGYVYRHEHEFEMPVDEERIAIASALHGMGLAVQQLMGGAERKLVERLAKGVAVTIGKARSGSAHVAAPGGHGEFKA